MKGYCSRFPVELMSRALGVSRSGYYKWVGRQAALKTSSGTWVLNEEIKAVFVDSKKTYGSPRVCYRLQTLFQDRSVSVSTVARRMKALGLVARPKHKYIFTTQSNHKCSASPNVLNRQFKVDQLNKVWVSDITYIPTDQGWTYLTVILDLGDRAIVAWTLSSTLRAQDTVIKAFRQAVQKRGIPKNSGLMFHSDRGVQYACDEFRALLAQYKVVQSMSRKGNCWDNAVAESFFKTIKTEELDQYRLIKAQSLYALVFKYIEGWYNTHRIHSALKGKTPWDVFYEKSTQLAA